MANPQDLSSPTAFRDDEPPQEAEQSENQSVRDALEATTACETALANENWCMICIGQYFVMFWNLLCFENTEM